MEAQILNQTYYNARARDRPFAVGDRCLVHFSTTPRNANRKFTKRWKGPYTVTKVLGKVNLRLQKTPQSKPILVHVDRVKLLTEKKLEKLLDSKAQPEPESEEEAENQEEEVSASSGARQDSPAQEKNWASHSSLADTEEERFSSLDDEFYKPPSPSTKRRRRARKRRDTSPRNFIAPLSSDSEADVNRLIDQQTTDRQSRVPPRTVPAGAESSTGNCPTESSWDESTLMSYNYNPFRALRVTRAQAREQNLHVSGEGLPPTKRKK